MTTEILMVGAGAVGQVYAFHLQRGGANLSLFVRPRHALPSQLPLFPQVSGRATLEGFSRLTSTAEVQARRFDQVWLAVPSDALDGAWLDELLAATGEATVVALAPESEDRVPRARLVLGAIPFLAYQHPLPGEAGEPGLAYWIPPLARIPLSGPDERVSAVATLLKAGGLKPQRVRDAAKTAAPVTAFVITVVAALEGAGWTLRGFRGRWARIAAGGAREALRLAGGPAPARWVAQGWLLSVALEVASRIVPLNLERYLRFHFTKTGSQTRALLRRWRAEAARRELPIPHLEQLARALGDVT